MRRLNWLVAGIVCFALLLATASSAFAQEMVYEKVNPSGGFAYLSKRLGEKIKLFFLSVSAEQKERYYEKLAARRLAELKYVIDNNDMANFEKATTRYSSTVGILVDFIVSQGLYHRREPAAEVLSKHIPVIEQLMTRYDPTTAEWRFVKQDFDYLNIYISRLKE